MEKPRPGGFGFFLFALLAIFAVPGGVLVLAHVYLGDSWAAALAALSAGLGFVLIIPRSGLERVGPTRRNPDPEDHILTARERVQCFLLGCGFAVVTAAVHFVAPAVGLDDDSPITEGAELVGGILALVLIVRALYGVDHAHLPD